MVRKSSRCQNSKAIKREFDEIDSALPSPPPAPSKKVKKEKVKTQEIKIEPDADLLENSLNEQPLSETKPHLKDRKLKIFTDSTLKSPFPKFTHPTATEARKAHQLLSTLHGPRTRPKTIVANPNRAGCGDSPSVLDALVRTILSQNTSDVNSARAKQSMDAEYGGSDHWAAIAAGGPERLQRAIACGGLSKVKSRVIMDVLAHAHAKYGAYSLDHLFTASNDEAVRELISLKGVGLKTAACVLMFCLQRDVFPVDTHVHRLTGMLGWRPPKASRDETFFHLDDRIPPEDKYGLHILLIAHGKTCVECKAGGRAKGQCQLRKAFAK